MQAGHNSCIWSRFCLLHAFSSNLKPVNICIGCGPVCLLISKTFHRSDEALHMFPVEDIRQFYWASSSQQFIQFVTLIHNSKQSWDLDSIPVHQYLIIHLHCFGLPTINLSAIKRESVEYYLQGWISMPEQPAYHNCLYGPLMKDPLIRLPLLAPLFTQSPYQWACGRCLQQ